MPGRSDPNLRLLAPAAVAVFAIAALVVVLSSGVLAGGNSTDSTRVSGADRDERESRRARRRSRATYTVRAGDTLGSIAERTDTSVERLQELNPQLDPQALSAGQKIRLRE